MKKCIILLTASLFFGFLLCGYAIGQDKYEPTWESLDSRPTPDWFTNAKFGIFIHWGVYSVPAWAPMDQYSEWYYKRLEDEKKKTEGGPTLTFHNKVYGKDFEYKDFAPLFKAELVDPDQWADFFVRSGARYVVLTSKHHDGYCLWPSEQSKGWNSVDVGPRRDLLGELTESVRKRGLKMGFYYSLYEWFNPLYMSDVNRYVNGHMVPQFKDVVKRYKPSIIFSDGEWEHPGSTWKSKELLAWLFNDSPCRDEVVVNDRWGKGERSVHGGYYTTEYGKTYGKAEKDEMSAAHPWEENRGMGASFGFSRREPIDEYKSATELIHLLINLVSRGGNLLLDIGPTDDGIIPVIMQERLVQIGQWLEVNGEAIYRTRAWRAESEGDSVYYTSRDNAVYAICLNWPGDELVLNTPKPSARTLITLLGHEGNLEWSHENGRLLIHIPQLTVDEVPCRHAYVFKLRNIE